MVRSAFIGSRVGAVEMGIVEEGTLDAPHLVVHLRPLLGRIDAHFHVAQVEHAVAGLERNVGERDIHVGGPPPPGPPPSSEPWPRLSSNFSPLADSSKLCTCSASFSVFYLPASSG